MPAQSKAAVWDSFLGTLTSFDRKKGSPAIATRNSLAVGLVLLAALALRDPLSGVVLATGALNVAFSDGVDSYRQRARRMLMWSVLGGVAVFLGSILGTYSIASILLAAGWAFAAGMLVAISTQAGDLGMNTLVTLVVFAARPMSPATALGAGLLVTMGGLIQTGFAVMLWPIQSRQPQRQALGQLYEELAECAASYAASKAAPADRSAEVLTLLGRDYSLETERYRMLFDQGERIRLSLFALSRFQEQACPNACLSGTFAIAADVLRAVSSSLVSGRRGDAVRIATERLREFVSGIHANELLLARESPQLFAGIESEIDALAGRLRSAVRLSGNSTTEGLAEFVQVESRKPVRLRLEARFEAIRANLHLNSAAFRHAIRLASCIAIGEAIGRSIDWQRSYWIPMTVAVVLKPDFTGTFSRGVLRLLGTFGGLIVATALFHFLPGVGATEIALIVAMTFVLRYLGPANYGVFSAAVAAYVVALLSLTGVAPAVVITARGLNTALGGILALLSYAFWPTWEHTQAPEVFATMFDAGREYFRLVSQGLDEKGGETTGQLLDRARLAWRKARSEAELSVERIRSEPKPRAKDIQCLTSILASSHQWMHAAMAIEAGLTRLKPIAIPQEFRVFASDAELTLYFLSAALRGSAAALKTLPDLRQDHNRLTLIHSGLLSEKFVIDETDRLTNSLNTLREQIVAWLGEG